MFQFGCWSTNHSKAERERASKRYFNICQFMAQIDSDDLDNDIPSHPMQEFLNLLQMSDIEPSDQYLWSGE